MFPNTIVSSQGRPNSQQMNANLSQEEEVNACVVTSPRKGIAVNLLSGTALAGEQQCNYVAGLVNFTVFVNCSGEQQ